MSKVEALMKKLFPVGWYFEILYFGVAIATFEHTAWSFGTLFLGYPTSEYFSIADPIWARGGLVALAVDIGMFLVAKAMIEEGRKIKVNWWAIVGLILTFIVVGVFSTIAQAIFAVYHTPVMEVSEGVTNYWVTALKPITDAAPFIFAAALPIMAVMFTVSRIGMVVGKRQEMIEIEKLPQTYTLIVEGEEREYASVSGVKKAWSRYINGDKHVTMPETTKLALEATNS